MAIKSDRWIRRMVQEQGMIEPFCPEQVSRSADGQRLISYGTSSYGYDVRCADEFKVFTNINAVTVDPKAFSEDSFVDVRTPVCIIPPNSFVLARTVEYFRIPRDILTICVGKSTYARCFRGDTRVALLDGTEPTLEEMARRADEGEMFWGYAIGQFGRIIAALLTAPRFIGRDSLLEIALDNGSTIHCTPDHRFVLRDGRSAEAQALRPNDSLMPLANWTPERRPVMRGHMMQRYSDPTARALQSKISRQAWARDDGSRRGRQAEIARRMRIRTQISADAVRKALDSTGSIRGAARLLRCDRSVFRRFPEVSAAFRGRNHKVSAVRSLPGDHDVYCLTVPEAGNFALASGVFVHNCGIIVNVTPLEPEWEGHVTLEFSNTTPLPAKVYAHEGVAQMLFLGADEPCTVSYRDRQGKYQGQRGVTLPRT